MRQYNPLSNGIFNNEERGVFSMKKTLTRVLSLVMILAMFVSAMPLAMAEEIAIAGITLTGPSGSLTGGQTAQIGCTVTPEGATENVEWSCSPTSVASVVGDSAYLFWFLITNLSIAGMFMKFSACWNA